MYRHHLVNKQTKKSEDLWDTVNMAADMGRSNERQKGSNGEMGSPATIQRGNIVSSLKIEIDKVKEIKSNKMCSASLTLS